jgi:hypothetical protein
MTPYEVLYEQARRNGHVLYYTGYARQLQTVPETVLDLAGRGRWYDVTEPAWWGNDVIVYGWGAPPEDMWLVQAVLRCWQGTLLQLAAEMRDNTERWQRLVVEAALRGE